MGEYQMAMAAIQRPKNYSSLPPDTQWAIDKSLGILDWDGISLKAARECVDAEDGPRASAEFKMSLDELRQVVRGFDLRFQGD